MSWILVPSFFYLGGILVYVILISMVTLMHFQLGHNMFVINNWINEYKWGCLFFVKFIVLGSFLYFHYDEKFKRRLVKNFKSLFLVPSQFFIIFFMSVASVFFYSHIEAPSDGDFQGKLFFLVGAYFLMDVLWIHFVKKNEGIPFALAMTFMNGLFLALIEVFDFFLWPCYLMVFFSSVSFILIKGPNTNWAIGLGLGGLAYFIGQYGVSYPTEEFLVGPKGPQILAPILFLALCASCWALAIQRSQRTAYNRRSIK